MADDKLMASEHPLTRYALHAAPYGLQKLHQRFDLLLPKVVIIIGVHVLNFLSMQMQQQG